MGTRTDEINGVAPTDDTIDVQGGVVNHIVTRLKAHGYGVSNSRSRVHWTLHRSTGTVEVYSDGTVSGVLPHVVYMGGA